MLDPVVGFFLLGLVARLGRSDLRVPEALYEALSIYLLLAIGIKGGLQLAQQPLAEVWPVAAAAMVWSALIPLLLIPVLRIVVRLDGINAAAVAAHYGSVSVVTFAVAQGAVMARGWEPAPWLALLVALMEAPGIVVGVILARRALNETRGTQPQSWGQVLHEVFFGKAIVLLTGGLLIGWVFGPKAFEPLDPLFSALFKGVLALFMLELGLVVAQRLPQLRRAGFRLVAFAIAAPLSLGLAGAWLAMMLGLPIAGMVIFATLSASASYIAAPTALRMAVPQADPALSIGAALGVTFPFNVLVGIPIYMAWAEWLMT
ncbi:MAG: sodium-dependent bicarbonate transport family permease [Burkholderiales bacterium]|jgi:hypothetical protein